MHVEMGEDGLNVTDISRDQVALLAQALRSASDQGFMEDADLARLFKLLAVVQSDLWDDMTSGKFDFSGYKKQ
ncbi:hypothetical protein [Acidihalobacter ferrooxydans]|uniref:Uncharacterized protein n=1 Tax=Acidihalobacter ferrooxydans TaxID=1765967 RepID=A0A1P8UHS4_9GAMM|nr:hypothetical protein [Acidihalobacter ferrooxydans]APZ43403.1 hypothetical protein BW247_10120 [Acidihalobacter ferrooxydans]